MKRVSNEPFFLTSIVLSFCCAACWAAPPGREIKQAVPDAGAVTAAAKRIRGLYEVEFLAAAKNNDLKIALAQKLLQQGQTTHDNPAGEYALLIAARDNGAQAGQVDLALLAVDALDHEFMVDALALKADAIKIAAKAAAIHEQYKPVSDAAWSIGQIAAARDEMEIAEKLCTLGATAAQSSREQAAIDHWTVRRRQLDELKLAAAPARDAQAHLKKNPREPDANLVLGKYRCLFKGDWPGGLLFLARGSDEALKALAIAELTGPADSASRLKLGDDWWQFAQTQLGLAKSNALRRAAFWYERALPDLAGLNKAQAQQRIGQAAIHEPATTIFAHTPLFWPDPPLPEVRRREATGTLYVCGDNAFELAINGKLLCEGRRRPVSLPVTLRLGDVITARAVNDREERGLLLYWREEDRKSAFGSNTADWHWFVPDAADKWSTYEPKDSDPFATVGDPNYLRIDAAAGWGAEPIWGADHSPAYLCHTISERDLSEIRAPAVAIDRDQKSVAGRLFLCADDMCDVMLNGVPLAHARSATEEVPVSLAPGDILAVKTLNVQFERGCMLQFVSKDGRATFVTQTATWHSYTPGEPNRWWLPSQAASRDLAQSGEPKHLKIDVAPKVPIEAIWGQGKKISYLFHEVTEIDLQPRGK